MPLVKISESKAYKIELIKFEANGPAHVSIRQMYMTKKDSEWKPGRNGLTLSTEEHDGKVEARRVLKAVLKVLDSDAEPKLIESRK